MILLQCPQQYRYSKHAHKPSVPPEVISENVGATNMAETLGSLCDKLSIVKLKQYHCDDEQKSQSLAEQTLRLSREIDVFLLDAMTGKTPLSRLTFCANKIFKQEGNELGSISDSPIGGTFAELAKVNCELWHEQEKVYAFETVPDDEKNKVVKRLALLNLKRNQCIDAIDKLLVAMIKTNGARSLE